MITHYLEVIAAHNKTPYGDALLECMEHYNVYGLCELTETQLYKYCLEKGYIK